MINEMLTVALLWCRAEPVIPNGDDYLVRGDSIEYSCKEAIQKCEEIYSACEFTGCGQVAEEENFDSRRCNYSTGAQDYD